jgi:hypothetical protein
MVGHILGRYKPAQAAKWKKDNPTPPYLPDVSPSYAYHLNCSFGFSVAFTELCAIKARAQSAVLLQIDLQK